LQIGVASELLRSHNLLQVIDLVAAAGFQGIEIWVDHWQRSELTPRRLLRHLQSSGLAWTMHADMRDLNLTSSNSGIYRESLRQINKSITLAAAIEARVLTLHPGHMSSSKGSPEDYWPRQVEVFARLADHAAAAGVQLAVENMEPRAGEFIISLADIQRLLAAVGRPSLGVTLDLAHLYGQERVEAFITGAPQLVNVHLSDASPGCRHLLLGRGESNYRRLLDILCRRYDGLIILEGYTPEHEKGCLDYLYQKWQEYLNGGRKVEVSHG